MPDNRKRSEVRQSDKMRSDSTDAAREQYLSELEFMEKRLCWKMSQKVNVPGTRQS